MSLEPALFRCLLLHWYDRNKRDLPWRNAANPYRVWISEIMLQQTRVAAVLPYYERFLARFPDVQALAIAPEQDLLAAWAGLGYYSRARNLQKAAKLIVARDGFPRDYESLRELPGVGEYTAAAVASIAFGLKHAALDGNVARVLSRVTAEPGDIRSPPARKKLAEVADMLVDGSRPGDFNQAMMELGATVCLPSTPQCLLCPVADCCKARQTGRQNAFPVRAAKPKATEVSATLLLIERASSVLLWQRPPESERMAGFWELPYADGESVPLGQPKLPSGGRLQSGPVLGMIHHTIVNTRYCFTVAAASLGGRVPKGYRWAPRHTLDEIPLSTTAKKALACLKR